MGSHKPLGMQVIQCGNLAVLCGVRYYIMISVEPKRSSLVPHRYTDTGKQLVGLLIHETTIIAFFIDPLLWRFKIGWLPVDEPGSPKRT